MEYIFYVCTECEFSPIKGYSEILVRKDKLSCDPIPACVYGHDFAFLTLITKKGFYSSFRAVEITPTEDDIIDLKIKNFIYAYVKYCKKNIPEECLLELKDLFSDKHKKNLSEPKLEMLEDLFGVHGFWTERKTDPIYFVHNGD